MRKTKRFLLSLVLVAGSLSPLKGEEYRYGPLHVITIQVANYSLPGLETPPFKAEFFQVLISTDTPGIVGFRVTLKYRENGEVKYSFVPALFQPGNSRYAWAVFPGSPDVLSIQVEELRPDTPLVISVKE